MRKALFGELFGYVVGGSDGNGAGDGPVVVLLHGFGAPGTDLVALAGELDVPSAVRFVFLMAPIEFEAGLPDTVAARAWWQIDMMELQVAALTKQYASLSERSPVGLEPVRKQVELALLAIERELSVAPESVLIGGFSQGAMLATDVVLHTERPFAALAILSGTVLTRTVWESLAPKRAGLPVLQSHGRADPILPFELAESLRDLLARARLEVDWVPFDGGHGIPPAALRRLSALAQSTLRLKASGSA
jgi:phospholipase/carboxylesterase